MPLLTQGRTFGNIRRLVAKVLLEHAVDSKTERPRLTQRDIATMVGTDWRMVHMSLKSLQDEGAIRIERHRIIINEGSLQKMAKGLIRNFRWLVTLALVSREPKEGDLAEPNRITVDEVKKRVDKGESILFIDTRNPRDWGESDVKLPGAVRIHYSELEQHLEELPRDRTIVTYCT